MKGGLKEKDLNNKTEKCHPRSNTNGGIMHLAVLRGVRNEIVLAKEGKAVTKNQK